MDHQHAPQAEAGAVDANGGPLEQEQSLERLRRTLGEYDGTVRVLTSEPDIETSVSDRTHVSVTHDVGTERPDGYAQVGSDLPPPERAAARRSNPRWHGEMLLWWEDFWYGRWGRAAFLAFLVLLVGLTAWALLQRQRPADTSGAVVEPAASTAAPPLPAVATPGTPLVSGGAPQPPTAVPPTTAVLPPTTAAPTGLIVFHSSQETPGTLQLYTLRVGTDNSGARRIPGTPRYAAHPRLSPDGTRVVFAGHDAGSDDLYVIRLDGSGLTRLTRDRGNNRFPVWSPDGKQLAFGSDRDGNWEIYRLNLDIGVESRLTNNPADDNLPSWSPDGQWLAFQSDRAQNMHLFKSRVDGSGVVQLTRGAGNNRYPAWSPDGRRLAFYSDRADGLDQLFALDADGQQETRLATSGGRDQLPTWSPDGRWIAFASERDGGWGIYLLGLGEGSARLLVRQPDSWAPHWVASP